VDNTVVWQTADLLTAPQATHSQQQASFSTVGMQNKPSQPVRISPDMLQNKTWIFQHFSNPGRFGNVELSFVDGSVNAKNNVSTTQGTYQTKEDMLCLSLKLWGESCMLVLKDVDGIILVSTNNSARSRVTVK
jgi:hypothetical protein